MEFKEYKKIQALHKEECDVLPDFNSEYFLSHLITYIGNKRRLLPFINEAIVKVKKQLKKEKGWK